MNRALLFLLLLVGCKAAPPRPTFAATAQGFAQPINIVDTPNQGATILGADPVHPIFTATGVGDGGVNVGTLILNDAGNPAPVDQTLGDLQSSVAHFVVATTAGVVADAGGTFVGANFCNASTTGGWLQFFAQTAIDAGGTNDAGTAPLFMTPYLPSLGCGSLQETQTFSTGLTWYSSSTQGLLTVDAGVPSFSVDVVHR